MSDKPQEESTTSTSTCDDLIFLTSLLTLSIRRNNTRTRSTLTALAADIHAAALDLSQQLATHTEPSC